MPDSSGKPNGPLELEDAGGGDVNQNIYSCNSAGTGLTGPTRSENVGTFTFHPSHDHIHYDDYGGELHIMPFDIGMLLSIVAVLTAIAVYLSLSQIDYIATKQCGSGDRKGEKVSFCIWDTTRVDDNVLPWAPDRPDYDSCGSKQGMSVGWGDLYGKDLPDQWVDLGDEVVDGPSSCWKLCIVINPERNVEETSYDDNECCIFIEFSGGGSRSFQEVDTCSC